MADEGKGLRPSQGEATRKERSRAARVALWTGKAVLKVTWGGVKLVGKGMWWAGKTGYRAGKRAGKRRRRDADLPPEQRPKTRD